MDCSKLNKACSKDENLSGKGLNLENQALIFMGSQQQIKSHRAKKVMMELFK